MRVFARIIGCGKHRHPMLPYLTNQNDDVLAGHAYLNLELTPLSLSLWQRHGPPSFFVIDPSLELVTW